MKLPLSIFLLLSFVVLINGWVGLIGYDPDEFAKNGITDSHCFTKAYDLNGMESGQVKRLSNTCAIATCNQDRTIRLTGCGLIVIAPPCYIAPGNLSKPYPQCCYEVVCPGPADEIKENKL